VGQAPTILLLSTKHFVRLVYPKLVPLTGSELFLTAALDKPEDRDVDIYQYLPANSIPKGEEISESDLDVRVLLAQSLDVVV
jgi:hypothetical protein